MDVGQLLHGQTEGELGWVDVRGLNSPRVFLGNSDCAAAPLFPLGQMMAPPS